MYDLREKSRYITSINQITKRKNGEVVKKVKTEIVQKTKGSIMAISKKESAIIKFEK